MNDAPDEAEDVAQDVLFAALRGQTELDAVRAHVAGCRMGRVRKVAPGYDGAMGCRPGSIAYITLYAAAALACAGAGDEAAPQHAAPPAATPPPEVSAVVGAAEEMHHRCLFQAEEAGDPDPTGELVLAWTIRDGHAESVRVVANTTQDAVLAACFTQLVKSLTFAAGPPMDVAGYSWAFTHEEAE